MNRRSEALSFWRSLPDEQRKILGKIYYPGVDFILITTSSSKIEEIYIQSQIQKELAVRPGNKVTFGGSEILTVTETFTGGYYALNEEGESFKSTWADLRPIRLTYDTICGLLGFSAEGNGIFVRDWLMLHYNLKTKTFDFLLNEPRSGKVKASPFHHVHEIQNLWHLLTGMEIIP